VSGQTPVTPGHQPSPKSIWRDFAGALLFTLALLAAKSLTERTVFGEHVELMTYNLLQHRLLSTRQNEALSVVIVDISDLETVSSTGGTDGRKVTSRVALQHLVQAMADQWPRAIGIDIDFSPDSHGYVTPHDPEFFQFCLDLEAKTHIPIFLGVERALTMPPDVWLGNEDYRDLAASIVIPKDSKKMPRWIQIGESASRRPTMSAALAGTFQNSSYQLPEWLGWALEHTSEKRLSEGISVGEFLIDYSALESLERERLRTKNPVVVSDQGWLLRDKVALVGDATLGKSSDTFVIPDRQEPFPGIYVHASAAYTLIGAPLYELTGTGRWVIDLLLSLLVIGPVALVRLRYGDGTSQELSTERLQSIMRWLAVTLVVIGGAVLVRTTRLMWDDFMLVAAGLLLHPSAERFAERLRTWMRNTAPSISHK
jgi:hypothetical protein